MLDFWENFERFQLNPEGVEPTVSTPVAVRYFRQLVRLLAAGIRPDDARSELRFMINELPDDSAGVREYASTVREVRQDLFWDVFGDREARLLSHEVAPLMRYLASVDLGALSFASRCVDLMLAIRGGSDRMGAAGDIRDSLMRLPMDHPALSAARATVEPALRVEWFTSAAVDDVWNLKEAAAAFMGLRQSRHNPILVLDLEDELVEQRWIVVGPGATHFDPEQYREAVESRVRELVESHPAMLRLAVGEALSDQDVAAIESLLAEDDLRITEENLKTAYNAPHGSLVALLKNALGIELLPDRNDAIRDAFEAFIAEHSYLRADQILFVRLFAQRLIAVGRVERPDLYAEPFTRLGGVAESVLPSGQLDELLALAGRYEVS